MVRDLRDKLQPIEAYSQKLDRQVTLVILHLNSETRTYKEHHNIKHKHTNNTLGTSERGNHHQTFFGTYSRTKNIYPSI